jgi:2-polyprenyl-3-methyl-5-hydroxy-6-metoxy-1,4-benzoquinol methylase
MRKAVYEPFGSQECFIVPLLAKEIGDALAEITFILTKNRNNSREKLALDCGCGNQPFRSAIIQHGFDYESLDVLQNKYNNVDYLCALDAPFKDYSLAVTKKYSLVLATEVLEHVSDWYAAFANIASVMEPGGYALLTAPFFYPLHEEPYDFCRPTVHQFEKVSRSAGLEVHSIKKAGNAVDVMGTILGASRITYSLHAKSSIFAKIINRFLLKSQEIVFKLLVKYRNRLDSGCESIYLSNVVVLKKVLPC